MLLIAFAQRALAINHASQENAAPFSLKKGDQIIFGNRTFEVAEIIDSDPQERDGTLYYRRVARVK